MSATMSPNVSSLGRIDALPGRSGQTVSGVYLLTGAEERISKANVAYLHLVLENASGRMTGSVWTEHRHRVELPVFPAAVSLMGRVKVFDQKAHLNVERLSATAIDAVPYATDLLPRQRCPEKALHGLDALTALERALPAPLDGFLKRVLLDPAIGLPFLRCRASVSHHHGFAGGLLAHSTQMLDVAAELARQVLPDDPTAPAMAQLGLLLHDLGKLRTVGEVRRPQGALVVPHEFITIELLASHLRWLEHQDHQLALALRYLLTYLATPKKARKVSDYAVAEITERLDELSAATHHCRNLAQLTADRRWLPLTQTLATEMRR